MLVICKICKSKIERDKAYKVIIKNKNNYYCSKEEYDKHLQENESRKKVIELSFEIIGKTTNTALMKELSEIAKVYSYTKISNYLEENLLDIDMNMSKEFTSEYGKIRYFTAIIKNSIGDFVPKNTDISVEIEETIDEIEEVKYKSTIKKSFTDFIDEY